MPPNPLAQPFAPPLAATATKTQETTSNPTLPALSAFLLSHLPTLSLLASASEVPWLYHSPTPPRPNSQPPRPLPSKPPVERLVLSITPTEGVYNALGAAPPPAPLNLNDPGATQEPAPPPIQIESNPLAPAKKPLSAAFLHRPWTLSRIRLPRGTTVWSSHKGFDEALTVGCNFALLEKLGLDVQGAAVLTGYKGDEGRRIGAVAGVVGGLGMSAGEVRGRVMREFGGLEGEGGWFGFEDGEGQGGEVRAVGCMNAFHPEEVERVAALAVERGFVSDGEKCEGLVYLTGAVREEGLKAAREKGMRVVCVGHRVCEVWGIRYLAERVGERWPGFDVRVVDEEEVRVEKTKNNTKKKNGTIDRKTNEKKGQKGAKDGKGNEAEKTNAAEMSKRRKVGEDESEDGGVAL